MHKALHIIVIYIPINMKLRALGGKLAPNLVLLSDTKTQRKKLRKMVKKSKKKQFWDAD